MSMPTPATRRSLILAMNLSVAAGFAMLVMKIAAYLLTRSSAILSDAAESVVHIVAVCFAAYSLRLSHRPADPNHPYGHAKISFFSAGFEGGMIVLAALFIIYSSVEKIRQGPELENLGFGTVLTVLAALINGGLGAYLVWLGRQRKSMILEANGKHVFTDCWTSGGVVVGLSLAMWTGWHYWDPIAAILMGLNILYSGFRLMRESVGGLMDEVDEKKAREITDVVVEEISRRSALGHEIKVRPLGDAYAIEMHLLFPDRTSVLEAHERATEIELAIAKRLNPEPYIITHIEPLESHDEAHDFKSRPVQI